MPTPSVEFSFPLNQDFADLLLALNARGAKYLVFGGYAVGAYSQLRAIIDRDIFILCSEQNSQAVFGALADFGAPIAGYSPEDFNDGRSVFHMGRPPTQVDVLQLISAVDFAEA